MPNMNIAIGIRRAVVQNEPLFSSVRLKHLEIDLLPFPFLDLFWLILREIRPHRKLGLR